MIQKVLACSLGFLMLLWTGPAWSAWPNSADRLSSKGLIFSFYLDQYATPTTDGFWARWNDTGHLPEKNDLMSMFYPHYAPYSSGEPCTGIYASHAANMKAAKIDVVVLNWVGVYQNEQARIEQALKCFGQNGMKAIIAVYPNWTKPSSQWFQDMVTRLETVLGWYARNSCSLFNCAYYRDPATGYPLFWVGTPDQADDPNTAQGSSADWTGKINWYKQNTAEHGIFIAGETPLEWVRTTRFDGFYWSGTDGTNFGQTGTYSDQADHQWILYNLYGLGTYNQFYVGGGGPGIDERANCDIANPRVVDRQGGYVFDQQWQGIINAYWNRKKVDHAEVGWNDSGESEGIEPVTSSPPTRQAGFQSCGGRVPQTYFTYAPLGDYWYRDRNASWANQFKLTR
jgi:hypothetical protein